MGVRRVAIVLVVAVAGCGHRAIETSELPPCVLVERVDRSGGGVVAGGRGQGLWVGDRVLTAAHVLLPVPRKPELVGEVILNGVPARILDSRSGDLETVAAISADLSFTDPDQLLEDWAVVRVSVASPRPVSLVPWQGPLNAGDTLYAVGFAPTEGAKEGATKGAMETRTTTTIELHTIPLRVAEVASSNGRAIDSRLVGVRTAGREDLRGWSGAFVGRYDATGDKWRFVGLLMGMVPGSEDSTAAFVVRVPAAAWEWMMR